MNEKKKLLSFVNSMHELPKESFEAFYSIMENVSYSKGTILIQQGDNVLNTYFVLEGAQRVYHKKNGKEHIIHLTYPPAFAGVPESYLGKNPSPCYLECLSDSTFLRFSKSSLGKLMDEDHQIERFVRIATTEVMVGVIERYYSLMSLPMKERFIRFMSKNAHILQLVPHKYIASYLNIDPTNFSKLLGNTRIG